MLSVATKNWNMTRTSLVIITAMAVFAPPTVAQCDSTETAALLCYAGDQGDSQGVNVSDVQFAASYLRAYGAQTRAGRLLTMTAADAAGCAEWTLYTHGSVLVLAKHINSSVDTTVLYGDVATTIDGGVNATADQQALAIIGCGTNGGSLGVAVNASNPAYTAKTYPAGNVTEGILIKVVASGA